MSDNEEINLDFLTQEDGDNNDGEEQNGSLLSAAAPEQGETQTVTIGDEEYNLVPAEQGEACTECQKLKQRNDELEEKLEKHKKVIQEFQQERQEELQQQIRDLNDDIPENKRYSEEELEQKFQESEIPQLEDTVDVMQRLVPEMNQSSVQSGKEDLTGTSQGGSDPDEEIEGLNQASQNLFGKGLDEKLNEIEEKHNE